MRCPTSSQKTLSYSCSGSLWDLHERCAEAKGFRQNCLELDCYVKAILRVFDSEGRVLPALWTPLSL